MKPALNQVQKFIDANLQGPGIFSANAKISEICRQFSNAELLAAFLRTNLFSLLQSRSQIVSHTSIMRPLTETETKTLFEKLANYTGRSLNNLLTDNAAAPKSKTPDRYVFRIQKDRVYYVRESLANLATSVARDNLLSLGTCLGKFTKTGKFRLHITALDVIAPHARYKVWVKANGEMPFLYGGHIVKAHVGRWSEDAPEHAGVIVMSMNDTPLVSAETPAGCSGRRFRILIVHRDSASPLVLPPRPESWILRESSHFVKLTSENTFARRTLYSPRETPKQAFGL